MKKNILIVSFWIIALIGCFALKSKAQSDTTKYRIECGSLGMTTLKKQLIADETWLTHVKTGAKITTTLESVFQDISLKYGHEFQKITITHKSANGTRYKEYVILMPESTGNNITQWAKKNL